MTTPYPFVAGAVLTAQQLNDIQNLPISDKTASYVLTVTDVYKRTMMNSASATTITVNNSIFTVGDVIQVANKGAGICTSTAGVGVTINTSGSLALAQYGGGYLLCLSASTFTFFSLGGIGYGAATGGSSSSITVGGINYTLLTFTSDGNLVVSRDGLFDICLIGGGGGGGSSLLSNYSGGGGGAGGIVIQSVYLTAATYAIDIGAGGTGATTSATGTNGAGSSINNTARSFSTIGGGYGAWTNAGIANVIGAVGSSGGGGGGGAAAPYATGLVSLFPTILGFAGGNGATGSNQAGGGGGGATAVGSAAVTTTGGAGGAGYDVSAFIGGSALFKAGGGGGGSGTSPGAGGSSVGGAGGTAAGNAAAANTGGGGGGAGSTASSNGGAGGSGVVYVRIKS